MTDSASAPALSRRPIDPGWPWLKTFGITAGERVEANGVATLYLSGLLAFDQDGALLHPGDMYGQCTTIFAAMAEAIASEMATSGGSGGGGGGGADNPLAHVVKITSYLTDLSLYPDFKRARAEAFPDGVPASTAIGCADLLGEGSVVEIEAVAVLG